MKTLVRTACLLAALGTSVTSAHLDGTDAAAQRATMVARIRDSVRRAASTADDVYMERALKVIGRIPRERFVPEKYRGESYGDTPLPIGYDQTISDAYVVAVMTAAAHIPEHGTALDVGTGSGYQAAVLAGLTDRVFSIEIVQPLAKTAKARLAALNFHNVDVRAGDGFAGWPEHAPFDAIIVAAGAAKVPQPLLDQLKPGGRIVMPIGPSWAQEQILVITKEESGKTTRCSLGWAMFVPLTGQGARDRGTAGLYDTATPLCYGSPVSWPELKSAATPPR